MAPRYLSATSSVILCFFVSYSSERDVTIREFNKWKSSTICTNLVMKKHLSDVCLSLKDEPTLRGKTLHSDDTIKQSAKCEKVNSVQLKDGEVKGKLVLKCELAPGIQYCVTKGSVSHLIIKYSFLSETSTCANPLEGFYDFHPSGSFWWLEYLKFWNLCISS